jgi:hypothetical protein
MSEMTIAELERLTGRDHARERQEMADALRLCDELEALDKERAADHVEEVLALWKDPWGYPLPGFESPRFIDARKAEYYSWLMSPAGARTRENVHPAVEVR